MYQFEYFVLIISNTLINNFKINLKIDNGGQDCLVNFRETYNQVEDKYKRDLKIENFDYQDEQIDLFANIASNKCISDKDFIMITEFIDLQTCHAKNLIFVNRNSG